MLKISSVDVTIANQSTPIARDISLTIDPGALHVIMGQNGSGKSSLAQAIAGHPNYEITRGSVELNGVDITTLSPDKRAQAGLFFTMQHPVAVPGVSVTQLLRTSWNTLHPNEQRNPIEFQKVLYETMDTLSIDRAFASRAIHDGFSGGEQKRLELLQLAVLNPSFAVLDELDSGLDVDAVQLIATQLKEILATANLGVLLITHSTKLLHLLQPTHVSVMHKGTIIKHGNAELIEHIDQHGYDSIVS